MLDKPAGGEPPALQSRRRAQRGHRPRRLLFEKALGREAGDRAEAGDPFDIQETAADISDTTRDFGWTPKVPVEEGIPKFVEWFKALPPVGGCVGAPRDSTIR